MALTRITTVSDGSKVLYDVSFTLGYIRKAFVYVYLEGDEYTDQLDYTWVNNTQIQLSEPLAAGVVFHIRRVVDRNKPVNDYVDGAIIREENLDNSFVQALMLFEEIEDGFMSVLPPWVMNGGLDIQGTLDVLNKATIGGDLEVDGDTTLNGTLDAWGEVNVHNQRIRNVAAPANANDATSQAYVNSYVQGLIEALSVFDPGLADVNGIQTFNQEIEVSFTPSAGKNMLSIDPSLTIGTTVGVPVGSRWVIL